MQIETPRQFRAFVRLLFISKLVVLSLIVLFASTPLYASATANLLALTTAQEWASQRIAKDALLMQGAPTQRAAALNELQNELPYWERNQAQLKDSPLPPDIDVLFASGNVDYVDIDTAARQIAARPTAAADPVQVAIILEHERDFFLTETQIVSALRARQMAEVHWLFGILAFLLTVLMGLTIWQYTTITRLLRRYMHQHPEAGHAASP